MTKPKLKIIPLGGLSEIGKNMMVIESPNDLIVIDGPATVLGSLEGYNPSWGGFQGVSPLALPVSREG